MSHQPVSPRTGPLQAALPISSPLEALTARAAGIGTGLVGLGIALILLLHVIPPSNEVNPMTRTISEYALGANGWIFDLAVLALAVGSVAVLAGLVRGGVVRAWSGASVFVGFWSLGLTTLVFFEKYDFAHGVSHGASGAIHRLASLVAFLSLPVAALLTLRSAARQRPPRPRWRRPANWTRCATLVSLACLAVLFYTFGVAAVTGTPWWRVLPIGALERLIALSEVATVFALGCWARRATGPPRRGVPPGA